MQKYGQESVKRNTHGLRECTDVRCGHADRKTAGSKNVSRETAEYPSIFQKKKGFTQFVSKQPLHSGYLSIIIGIAPFFKSGAVQLTILFCAVRWRSSGRVSWKELKPKALNGEPLC